MPTAGQRLSATDRTMLAVDRILYRTGGPGFATQMFVALSGPADPKRLQSALIRLDQCQPVVTARLADGGGQGEPYWRFRPDAIPPLRETTIESSEPECLLAHAARLLSEPTDLTVDDPIRFHLLHRPDGRDVFLLQYNHALMDNNAAVPLLREIDRLATDVDCKVTENCRSKSATCNDAALPRDRDLAWDFLRRFPRDLRRRAVQTTGRQWGRAWQGRITSLGRGRSAAPGTARVRIVSRHVGAADVAALRGRTQANLGLPSLSMALAAGAFRAIGRLAPHHGRVGRNLIAGIGVDLGLRGRDGPLFQNLVSLVPLHATMEDLDDRDRLVRLLGRQLRDQLAAGADLGVLQQAALMGRQPWHESHWLVEMVLRHGFSLWYGYFGALDAVGDCFCGTPIEDVFFAGPCWPPLGMTLVVNQFRGRLMFQATYVPAEVPDAVAGEFLDRVIGDVTTESS
jgi:hypothetical protein